MSEEKNYEELVTRHGTYRTLLTKKYRNRKPFTPADPKQIRSFIPGEVTGISVKAGQTVKAGEELMMFKAIKMENRIKAPIDGTIKSVIVQLGDNLSKGSVMIEFE